MRLGGGDGSLSCGSTAFLKKVMDRRKAAAKAKNKGGKDTATSVTASPVSARDHGPSDDIDDILMSESCGVLPSLTSAGVVANVPRRDGSVGPINQAKGRCFMEYNTVIEQTPISGADIEHFVHTISAVALLLGISFLSMGANAIHSTVANVPEGLLLIGLTLTAKCKRMLATNLEGVETTGCTSCTCSEMGTLAQNKFMNGTATSTCTNVLLCVMLSLHHVCKQ